MYPTPLVPVINQIFAATFEVINGPFDNYQWYLNSEIIPGEILSVLNFYQSGIYTVEVSNSYGCVSTSDIFFLLELHQLMKMNLMNLKFFQIQQEILYSYKYLQNLGDNCVVEIYDPTGKQINVHNMNQKNYVSMVNLSGYNNGGLSINS